MINFDLIEGRKKVVRCPIPEQAIQFYDEISACFPDKVFNWNGAEEVVDNWEDYKEDFCFSIYEGLLMYSSVDYYLDEGYSVIEFEELMEEDKVYEDIGEAGFFGVLMGG